jgi:hypothetical protein
MNVDQLTRLESKLHIKIKKTLLMERHEWNINGFKDGSYLSSNKRTQVENENYWHWKKKLNLQPYTILALNFSKPSSNGWMPM